MEIISSFEKTITEKMLSEIKFGSIKVFEKTKRIISVGEFWLIEEWLRMFTYRFELEFIKDFLLDKGLSFPKLNLHGLCEEMKAASLVGKKTAVSKCRECHHKKFIIAVFRYLV